MSQDPRIAIIGAGPAGCSLARLLLQAQIGVTVFESEASASARSQGGTLDLHSDTGIRVLQEAGLYDEFLKYARYDGEAFALADKTLKIYIAAGGTTSSSTSRGRPEIDRTRLRQILLDSLPPGTIRWGYRLRSIDPEDLSLHFDNGEVEKEYDLIVGADGAWSKVRPLLSPTVQPIYCGLGGMNLVINEVEKRFPDLHALANRGSIFCFSDGKSITAQQLGDGSLSISAWSRRDENWMQTCGYDIHNAAAVKQALLREYEDWAPPLVKLLRVAADEDSVNDHLTARCIYELPLSHHWSSRAGVTLIGDAAHLATPFVGEGVNIAMDDALCLSRAIIIAFSSFKSLSPSSSSSSSSSSPPSSSPPSSSFSSLLASPLRAFEEDMFRRGAAVQSHSRANMLDMYFAPGAPASSLDRYVRRALLGPDTWVEALLPLWVVRVMLSVRGWWRGGK